MTDGTDVHEITELNLDVSGISCDKYTITVYGTDEYTGEWVYYRSNDGVFFTKLKPD